MASKKPPKSPRRSLGDAMTPEMKAFLAEGKATTAQSEQIGEMPTTTSPPSLPSPIHKPEEPPMPAAALKESPIQPHAELPVHTTTVKSVDRGAMFLNTRIAPELSDALMAAYMDRRMQRRNATQREIVEEALADWLKRHGFF